MFEFVEECGELALREQGVVLDVVDAVTEMREAAACGAGAWVTTPARRPAGGELSLTQQTANRALSKVELPV